MMDSSKSFQKPYLVEIHSGNIPSSRWFQVCEIPQKFHAFLFGKFFFVHEPIEPEIDGSFAKTLILDGFCKTDQRAPCGISSSDVAESSFDGSHRPLFLSDFCCSSKTRRAKRPTRARVSRYISA